MPGMNPVDIATLAQRFRDSIETIADNSIDPANANRVEHLCDSVCNFHCPVFGVEHLRDNVHGLVLRKLGTVRSLADD
jgi:hypothetical protein